MRSGSPLAISGEGYYYEGEFFSDYWDFGGGLDGSLRVWYGEGGAEGFVGALKDATIEEHEAPAQRRSSGPSGRVGKATHKKP